jgi:transposase
LRQSSIRKPLRRGEVLKFFASLRPCLVGIEACATAHHWGRELGKLGHTIRLMPPAYVKAYVKRGKTDAADAEAICEAVTRPTMRFVAVKSMEQQGVLMLHKTRDLLVRQRTMLINALRGHLAELGIIAAQGSAGVKAAIEAFHMAQDSLPALACKALHGLIDQMRALAREIERPKKRSWPGTARTQQAGVWPTSPASGRSLRAPSRRRYPMRRYFLRAAPSQHGLV